MLKKSPPWLIALAIFLSLACAMGGGEIRAFSEDALGAIIYLATLATWAGLLYQETRA